MNTNTTTYATNELNQYTSTSSPSESFTHDADGNLTQDGTLKYSWDAENRLIACEPVSPESGSKKVTLLYDWQGRRVGRKVFDWNTQTTGWNSTPTLDREFVFDGWRELVNYDALAGNAFMRSYTWGLDLARLTRGVGQHGPAGSGFP